MARAQAHADDLIPGWQTFALDALRRYARQLAKEGRTSFQTEELRLFAETQCDCPRPPDPRAWGPFIRGLACRSMPVLVKLGSANTQNPKGHRHPASIWGFTRFPMP
ncbi:hypothetical protein [Dyella japonica]|uniref:Uncharacterized protein n=1 Tax=Dyella japonica TaxID=231455 RepID=A0ABV2K0U6_9GAMM